ncbi:hypothetical protein [Shewanella sp. 125m-1]
MRIFLGVISFIAILASYLWGKAFLNFIILHPPVATMVSFVVAIAAVVVTQVWFDIRQKKQHEHDLNTKERERKQDKAEEIIFILEDIKYIVSQTLVRAKTQALKENQEIEEVQKIHDDIYEIRSLLSKSIGIIQMNFLIKEELINVADMADNFIEAVHSLITDPSNENSSVMIEEERSNFDDALISLADSIKQEVMSFLDKPN